MLETLVTIIHILVCLFLTIAVLLQAGKGAGMGALTGGSSSVFGGRGPATFLQKLTTITAFVFMLSSMGLSKLATKKDSVLAGEGDDSSTSAPAKAGGDGGAPAKSDAKGADAKPADAPKATDAKAADAKPADAKPADAPKAAAAKPTDAKPADAKPADAPKAADAKPAKDVKPGAVGNVPAAPDSAPAK